MKLCNFYVDNDIHAGVFIDGAVRDLTAADPAMTMEGIIAGGQPALDKAAELAKSAPAAEEPVRFANICREPKILCVGLNYRAHANETGFEEPKAPVLFSKFSNALAACGDDVVLPDWLYFFDHEAELVIVMGGTAWNVTAEEAEELIFGYTCGNDLSERKAQSASAQWLIGKSLPGFAPAGPYIVTKDSFDPGADHAITCSVNGTVAQQASLTDMIFSCAEIVSYASRYVRLEPGDLIFTGTPEGVIVGRPKAERVWLKPGDVVEVSIEGIGTLTNRMI